MTDIMAAVRERIETVSVDVPDRFNGFEPWDIGVRSPELIELAAKYGVALDPGPLPFQTGYLLSEAKITANIAATQVGKSIPAYIKAIMFCTKKVPICLRYPKGFDTGIKRNIDDPKLRVENIRRWGRLSIHTGELIDRNEKAVPDGTWDCGTIIGQGIYPRGLLPQGKATVWITTFKQAKDEYWWKNLKDWIPGDQLDLRRGVGGFSQEPLKVFFMDGSDISIITYEQGYNRVEAVMVDLALIDEEPPDRRFFTGVVEHAKQISMQFTPLNGISWAYEDIFLKARNNKNIKIFTATQYDSPYQLDEQVSSKLSLYKPWEVESKVFGMFSEQRGKPYFDREKVNGWVRELVERFERKKFEPLAEWTNAIELNRIRVRMLDADAEGDGVWRVYEQKVEGAAYFLTIDTALGTEDMDQGEVGDYNAAIVSRMPMGDEKRPVDVACYWTQGRVIPFARDCLAAARYWNNALMCPEVRGESAGVFMNEVVGYPFILKTTVVNDMTRKTMDKQGFYTTGKTRKEAFDLLADLIDNSESNPGIRIARVLEQAAKCIKGKSGRPDHERRDHDDVLFAYGIREWVYRYAKEQVKYHADKSLAEEKVRLPRWQLDKQDETRPILGSRRGMDTRRRERVAGTMPHSRRFI